MNNKLLIIILIIIIVTIVIYNKYNHIKTNHIKINPIKTKDTFLDPINPQNVIANDGNMSFDYLTDPYYSQKILKKYYIDDDKKQYGVKLNKHIYKNMVPNCKSSTDLNPYVYSADISLHCRRNVGWANTTWWHKYDTIAQDIYNNYGVRR